MKPSIEDNDFDLDTLDDICDRDEAVYYDVKLPIKDILIRPDRVRKDFNPKALDDLAESIRTVGLIEPIVLDDDNYLLAGERRLRACQSLGMTEVLVVYMRDLDPWAKAVVELEENLRREDLTYVEEVMAKKRLHELYQDKHGKSQPQGGRGHNEGWKVRDTAELLGISVGAVSQDIQLAKAIERDPELGQQRTKIAAKSMMGRKQALKARNLLAILSAKKTPSAESHGAPSPAIELIHSDCLSVIPSLDDNSIDCLITDPPWQVAFDEEFGSDKRTGLQLTQDMLSVMYPKLKDGSLCWLFCATNHMIKGTIYDLIKSCGYFIYDSLFIWYKPTVAHSSNPYRELKKDHEPALMFSKGVGRDLIRPMFSVFSTKLQGHKLHPAQKPVDMLRQLIEVSTVPNELICDPFMGSGSTMQACKLTNRRGLGIEMSAQWFSLAQSEVSLA